VDRCTDCHYSLALHFRKGTGPRAGEYLGCPLQVSARLGLSETYPRVSFRIDTRRGDRYDSGQVDRRGHVIVCWADYQDEDGGIMLWDLDTGDQWVGDLELFTDRSKRPPRGVIERAKEQTEDLIGGPVRVVYTVSKRRSMKTAGTGAHE
jgi:hypothetical protein